MKRILGLTFMLLLTLSALTFSTPSPQQIVTAAVVTLPCSQAAEACDGAAWGIIVSCYEHGGTYTECTAQWEKAHNDCMIGFNCEPLYDYALQKGK